MTSVNTFFFCFPTVSTGSPNQRSALVFLFHLVFPTTTKNKPGDVSGLYGSRPRERDSRGQPPETCGDRNTVHGPISRGSPQLGCEESTQRYTKYLRTPDTNMLPSHCFAMYSMKQSFPPSPLFVSLCLQLPSDINTLSSHCSLRGSQSSPLFRLCAVPVLGLL